jgi:hypothetical protein
LIQLFSLLFALQHTPLRADSEEQTNAIFHTEAAMNIAAFYEPVTNSIIVELERGTAPWIKPWKAGKRVGIMPAKAISGHHYRGINVPILWHAADAFGFPTNGWLTFKQALDAGGHVKKGEKGTQIVFTKRISVSDNKDEERQISMLRAFTVFNVAQIERIEALSVTSETPPLVGSTSSSAQPARTSATAVTAPAMSPLGTSSRYLTRATSRHPSTTKQRSSTNWFTGAAARSALSAISAIDLARRRTRPKSLSPNLARHFYVRTSISRDSSATPITSRAGCRFLRRTTGRSSRPHRKRVPQPTTCDHSQKR